MNAHYHAVMHFHFDVSAAPVKLSLREELEIAIESKANKLANIPSEQTAKELADLKEQLAILDAIELFMYIKPLPITEFERRLR